MSSEKPYHYLTPFLFTALSPFLVAPSFAENTPQINWSGVVEIEANHTSDYADETQSDLVVATAFLGAEAEINEELAATITLLYEEDDTPLEIDEAFLTHTFGKLTVTAGQLYLPFGQYQTSVITDPLTLEVGETRESALLLEADFGALQSTVYIFNGDADVNEKDKLSNFGFRLATGSENDELTWSASLDYISNIADADGIDASGFTLNDEVSGTSIAAGLAKGNIGISAEILSTDTFDAADLAFNSDGAQILITHLDLSYSLEVAGKDSVIGLSFNSTEEALALGLPETRFSLAFVKTVTANSSVSLEYFMDDDYGVSDGGTGESASTLLFQLAAEI